MRDLDRSDISFLSKGKKKQREEEGGGVWCCVFIYLKAHFHFFSQLNGGWQNEVLVTARKWKAICRPYWVCFTMIFQACVWAYLKGSANNFCNLSGGCLGGSWKYYGLMDVKNAAWNRFAFRQIHGDRHTAHREDTVVHGCGKAHFARSSDRRECELWLKVSKQKKTLWLSHSVTEIMLGRRISTTRKTGVLSSCVIACLWKLL